jgi:2-succinyl-5-enolpyruvyl-6-hydroxy-3-cyclohexene-1-carboxylate synthase
VTHPASAPASDFAAALLAEFVRLGVRDIVLSPGSRSQALALAAADLEAAGSIRLRVRIDERVAGFVALGLAVETRTPVLIITTSGTAVANLHPAVLEAHHSGVPLIVLSADRPAELRGIGTN